MKLTLKKQRTETSGTASAYQSQAAGGSTTTDLPAQTEAFLETGKRSWVKRHKGG